MPMSWPTCFAISALSCLKSVFYPSSTNCGLSSPMGSHTWMLRLLKLAIIKGLWMYHDQNLFQIKHAMKIGILGSTQASYTVWFPCSLLLAIQHAHLVCTWYFIRQCQKMLPKSPWLWFDTTACYKLHYFTLRTKNFVLINRHNELSTENIEFNIFLPSFQNVWFYDSQSSSFELYK